MTRAELAALMARTRAAAAPARPAAPVDPLDALGALADALDRLQKENRVLRQRLGIPLDADLWTDAPPAAAAAPVAADPLQDLDRVLSGLGRIHGVHPPAPLAVPRAVRNGHRRKDK